MLEIEQGVRLGEDVTINDNFFPGPSPAPHHARRALVEAMAQVGGLIMLDPEASRATAVRSGNFYPRGSTA